MKASQVNRGLFCTVLSTPTTALIPLSITSNVYNVPSPHQFLCDLMAFQEVTLEAKISTRLWCVKGESISS
jgi:hypothetical protein